jgi:hemolysin activation/secretion protein
LIANVFQNDQLFVDLVGGAKWHDAFADNQSVNRQGDTSFFIPNVGLRLSEQTQTASTTARARYEWNLPGVAATDSGPALDALGRFNSDADYDVLRFGFNHSTFLEPVLNQEAWEDPSSPESSKLAHELSLNVDGQYSFNDRLIPQETKTVGGFRRVRGYPESVASGDTAVTAGLEYRYHIPHGLPIEPEGGSTSLFGEPFQVTPRRPYGRADWDLICRAFLDAGWTDQVDRLRASEANRTLLGTGVGLEFRLRNNIRARVDWGFALKDLETPTGDTFVSEGSSPVHMSVQILY